MTLRACTVRDQEGEELGRVARSRTVGAGLVRELCASLVDGSGGGLLLGRLHGLAVAEAYALDQLAKALRTVQPTPASLR